MSIKRTSSTEFPVVTRAELPELAAGLVARVRSAGFDPDLIVYVERGARLLAWHMCGELRIAALAVSTRRRGNRFKRLAAPAVGLLPRSMRRAARAFEQRWFWSKAAGRPREVEGAYQGQLDARRVLVVDDAADSGRTIAGVRGWLEKRGVRAESVRVAVLCATTPAGRAAADFWMIDRNSCLPWSSDSDERVATEAEFERKTPKDYAAGDI